MMTRTVNSTDPQRTHQPLSIHAYIYTQSRRSHSQCTFPRSFISKSMEQAQWVDPTLFSAFVGIIFFFLGMFLGRSSLGAGNGAAPRSTSSLRSRARTWMISIILGAFTLGKWHVWEDSVHLFQTNFMGVKINKWLVSQNRDLLSSPPPTSTHPSSPPLDLPSTPPPPSRASTSLPAPPNPPMIKIPHLRPYCSPSPFRCRPRWLLLPPAQVS